jgi:hypothetical protein
MRGVREWGVSGNQLVNTGSSHQDAGEEKQNTRESGNEKGKKKEKRKSPKHVTLACLSIQF